MRRIFTRVRRTAASRARSRVGSSAKASRGPRGRPGATRPSAAMPQRGTGILNNELYVGRLVWNRLRYVKDPSTGKRLSRLNPPEAWITQDVPELRIIEDELWDSVKATTRSLARQPRGREGTGASVLGAATGEAPVDWASPLRLLQRADGGCGAALSGLLGGAAAGQLQ